MKKENVLNINTGEVTYWGGSVPMWFSIDLGPSKLFNTSCWCLRHGYNAANSFPVDIQLEARNDSDGDYDWTLLHKISGSPFTQPHEALGWSVLPRHNKYFRYFRVVQPGNYGMGPNGGTGSPYFCVSGFEMYGNLRYKSGEVDSDKTVLSEEISVQDFDVESDCWSDEDDSEESD